jgi:hypothetical protein
MSDRPGYRGKPAQVSVATGPAHLFVGRRSFLGHCRADDRDIIALYGSERFLDLVLEIVEPAMALRADEHTSVASVVIPTLEVRRRRTRACGPKLKHASTVRSCCLIEELALGLQIGDAVVQFDLHRLAPDFCPRVATPRAWRSWPRPHGPPPPSGRFADRSTFEPRATI